MPSFSYLHVQHPDLEIILKIIVCTYASVDTPRAYARKAFLLQWVARAKHGVGWRHAWTTLCIPMMHLPITPRACVPKRNQNTCMCLCMLGIPGWGIEHSPRQDLARVWLDLQFYAAGVILHHLGCTRVGERAGRVAGMRQSTGGGPVHYYYPLRPLLFNNGVSQLSDSCSACGARSGRVIAQPWYNARETPEFA